MAVSTTIGLRHGLRNRLVAGVGRGPGKVAAIDQFIKQLAVIMGAWTGWAMPEDILVQRRALGDGDVFGNDGSEVVAVAFAQFVADVVAHPAPAVEAGQQVAPFDATFEDRFKNLQRARDVVGSLQRQVIRWKYRDDQAVTGKMAFSARTPM